MSPIYDKAFQRTPTAEAPPARITGGTLANAAPPVPLDLTGKSTAISVPMFDPVFLEVVVNDYISHNPVSLVVTYRGACDSLREAARRLRAVADDVDAAAERRGA